jgi:hypothetical protein
MEHTQYLSMIGKRGGSAKTEAKADASRQNGKLGGRPAGSKTKRRDDTATPKPIEASHE